MLTSPMLKRQATTINSTLCCILIVSVSVLVFFLPQQKSVFGAVAGDHCHCNCLLVCFAVFSSTTESNCLFCCFCTREILYNWLFGAVAGEHCCQQVFLSLVLISSSHSPFSLSQNFSNSRVILPFHIRELGLISRAHSSQLFPLSPSQQGNQLLKYVGDKTNKDKQGQIRTC